MEYPNEVKQVLVLRRKYPNPKIEGGEMKARTGKLTSQAGHGASFWENRLLLEALGPDPENLTTLKPITVTREERQWLLTGTAKISLYVDSEEELWDISYKASAAGLKVEMVQDSGKTEFGEPMYTCCAIGPHYVEKFEGITDTLEML